MIFAVVELVLRSCRLLLERFTVPNTRNSDDVVLSILYDFEIFKVSTGIIFVFTFLVSNKYLTFRYSRSLLNNIYMSVFCVSSN